MISHARQQGIGFAWVGFDGFYGSDPALLRALEDRGEVCVGDVPRDPRIYLADPQPLLPPVAPRGRPPTRRQAQTPVLRVDHWVAQQPAEAWRRVTLRDGTQGPLQVEVLHQRVWLGDGEEAQARCWHLSVRREIDDPTELKYSLSNAPAATPPARHLSVRREIDDPTELKYSLSNAPAATPPARLAFMQGPRYWIERALQQGKQDVGLGDYPVRGWRGWHHPMALVMMALLFTLEEWRLHHQTRPLLSGTDIRALLNQLLPRRDTTLAEVLRQMERRHRKRQAATDSARRRKQLNEWDNIVI
jgi:hypothetical protein